jgi:hypothetical protein
MAQKKAMSDAASGIQMTKIGLPVARQSSNFQFRQVHNDELLPASDEKSAVICPRDGERTPKAGALELRQFAMNQQHIPQACRALIVYFSSHEHRAIALSQHFAERPSQLLSEQRPVRFNESQVCDVMHESTCVSVEKHDAYFCI